jgi:hypothetical protein
MSVNRHEYAGNMEGSLGWNRLNGHRCLQAWFIAEIGAARADGGHNQGGKFNPLGCVRPMQGSTYYNVLEHDKAGNPILGVQNYVSFAQGIEATVLTLKQPDKQAICDAMTKPNVTPSEVFAAIISSNWGTDQGLDGAYTAYMRDPGFYLTLHVGA